jgi:hypothetical protein
MESILCIGVAYSNLCATGCSAAAVTKTVYVLPTHTEYETWMTPTGTGVVQDRGRAPVTSHTTQHW